MKKMLLALSAVVSVVVLAGCSTQGHMASDQNAAAASSAQTAPAHHDYKGEKM